MARVWRNFFVVPRKYASPATTPGIIFSFSRQRKVTSGFEPAEILARQFVKWSPFDHQHTRKGPPTFSIKKGWIVNPDQPRQKGGHRHPRFVRRPPLVLGPRRCAPLDRRFCSSDQSTRPGHREFARRRGRPLGSSPAWSRLPEFTIRQTHSRRSPVAPLL
jgi:hypothetical protein